MKRFVDRNSSSLNFYERIKDNSQNTMIFENLNTAEKYKNKELKKVNESDINLFYIRNPVFDKLILRILYNNEMVQVTELQKEDWDLNPFLASAELYGTPDYWWILLIGNRMTSIHEFTKLPDMIYKPNITDIKEKIKLELVKSDIVGEVTE